MTTNAQDEASVQDSRPVELYTIVTPVATYTLTSWNQSITVNGVTYAAATISRNNSAVPEAQSGVRELLVSIAITHPLAQDLLINGIPMRDATVSIVRYQQRSGTTWGFWFGHISAIATNGVELQLKVPSKIDDTFAVKLPIAAVQRQCIHGLYDAGCTLQRKNFAITGTVLAVNGAYVQVSGVTGNPLGFVQLIVNAALQPAGMEWGQYGDIVRAADNERRSIIDLDYLTGWILLDVPYRTLSVGDQVSVAAGCDHQVTTCRDKFNNVVNYGGMPALPDNNIMAPTGFGVIQS